MEFFKKNYEKVILGVVLLGLTVGACLLPIIVHAKREHLESLRTNSKPKVKEIPPLDLTVEEAALKRAETPVKLDFTTRHNIFNPVPWKRYPDGHLSKEGTSKEGPDALEITALKPLYLELSYGSPSANGYFINIERQGAPQESKRHTQNFVSKESKGELISLIDVKGPPEKPTELTLQWNETGEEMTITPEAPFRQVQGYSADLKYPLEPGKVWSDRRVGSKAIYFANGYYNIVAITQSNVVVSAESNKKKTTITFHSANEPR